ncbi:hypothetical protein, partial [Escherichia coli]|uniref:hypothetical protein n=1 Tax=Escherichia coli TaxID=562 RepID=UPI00227EB455
RRVAVAAGDSHRLARHAAAQRIDFNHGNTLLQSERFGINHNLKLAISTVTCRNRQEPNRNVHCALPPGS